MKIISDPSILAGEWVVEGTELPAISLAVRLHSGNSESDILAEFPALTPGVAAAVRKWMSPRKVDRNRELIRNSLYCLLCNSAVESKHRHDLQPCACFAVMADGGVGPYGYWRRFGGTKSDPGETWVDTSIFVGDQRKSI